MKRYYNIMKPNDTDTIIPLVGFHEVVKALAPASYTPDRVMISFPEILKNITREIENTSKETIQTWFVWTMILSRYGDLRSEDVDPIRIFMNQLEGRVCSSLQDSKSYPEHS